MKDTKAGQTGRIQNLPYWIILYTAVWPAFYDRDPIPLRRINKIPMDSQTN